MDLVFKALADPSRRKLLDRLLAADGQTLRQLCTDLTMTRQAVTKHLVLLESAQLVASKKQGREKLHYLNPAPLHQISTRWIHKYANPSPIAGLKQPPARAMTAIETEGDSRWTNLHVP